MIVLDTSALLYWTMDPEQLSPSARGAIQEPDKTFISSISVWEIALKLKHRKLEIPLPIPEYAERIQNLGKLEILPVDIQTWLENLELDWDHRDPVDCTIVAIATRLTCPIVTSDAVMTDIYPHTI